MSQKENTPESPQLIIHSCEICGMTGLSDETMREHTKIHVDENAQCPFCGLSGILAAELLLHVNQAHLDYLTPENELMSFIDDQSPSVDGDSDSISECRVLSPSTTSANSNNHQTSSLNTSTTPTVIKLNGGVINGTTCSSSHLKNGKITSYFSASSKSSSSSSSGSSNHLVPPAKTNGSTSSPKNCDITNGYTSKTSDREYVNGVNGGGSQGSPLRSQLGLKLKPHKPTTNTAKPSPLLQCPLCPYNSENPSTLEEHINRSHFDPLSPSLNGASSMPGNSNSANTLNALQCPICTRTFESTSDLELHVNIEHRDILSPAKITHDEDFNGIHSNNSAATNGAYSNEYISSLCPVCGCSFDKMKTQEMELHIEQHFAVDETPASMSSSSSSAKSPPDYQNKNKRLDESSSVEKQAQKLREQREFEMLRAQYGMDDQGNFREQSAAAMQRAVYAGEMSVADYYERQVGLRAAEHHGVDDGSSCTKLVAARVLSLLSATSGVIKTYVCSGVDHYASSYGDRGWGCGYRNLQMMLSSLLQNTSYNEALYSAWGAQGPSRTAMPSISRLQRLVEAAWAQGFDIQGSEQLGCKLYNTRKWIGATEVVTVLSWLRIQCQLVDFHRAAYDGRHPELFNWVLRYFEEPKVHTPPLYLQHQGHSRTIIGIEQRQTGLTLLVLDPSHGPRQVAALGSSPESLRLIRRNPSAMKAPQYQIVAVSGLIDTEEQYQASKILKSLRIPPDR